MVSDAAVQSTAVTTGPRGLTAADVAQRVREGKVNTADERTSRTLGEIVRANVFTASTRFSARCS